jgi:Ca-activated chloride channel homolog
MTSSTCRALMTATAVIVVVSSQPEPAAAQRTVFKAGVDMVPLTVTVTNPAGHSVTGLTIDDFTVLEDGVQQSISFFASEPVPVDVAFVLDTSASMMADLPLVREAARGMVHSLRPEDRAAVINVKSVVGLAQSLTSDQTQIDAALNGLSASGGTAVYDGLYVVLRDFERERTAEGGVRRQVISLLSDGDDNASHVPADDVMELARRLGVSIYVIALQQQQSVPSSLQLGRSFQRAEYAMRALASETGGRIFFPTSAKELPALYAAIAQELASQYQLGYVPLRTNPDGAFRRISVRVPTTSGGTARTRSGYFAAHKPLVAVHPASQ